MEFRTYPLSYRFSQGGMAVAIASAFSPLSEIARLAPTAQFALLTIMWATVCISLCVSFYVIIRYPYLSLVKSSDSDHFMKYFASSGTRVYTFLKILAIAVVLMVIISLLVGDKKDPLKFIRLAYMITILCFLIFMTFVYNPISYPTIATFIRATVGVGVLLFPVFIPALVIGSIRCRRLLDNAAVE